MPEACGESAVVSPFGTNQVIQLLGPVLQRVGVHIYRCRGLKVVLSHLDCISLYSV